MNATLVAVLALSLGAPKIKDPVDKDPSVVGYWQLMEWTIDGVDQQAGQNYVHQYTADGRRILKLGDSDPDEGRTFKVVPGKKPHAIDLFRPSGQPAPDQFKAIYKIDGDTFTLVIAQGVGLDRPTSFDVTGGTNLTRMVFRRVKKD